MRVNYMIYKVCENCGASSPGDRVSCSGCGLLYDMEVKK